MIAQVSTPTSRDGNPFWMVGTVAKSMQILLHLSEHVQCEVSSPSPLSDIKWCLLHVITCSAWSVTERSCLSLARNTECT